MVRRWCRPHDDADRPLGAREKSRGTVEMLSYRREARARHTTQRAPTGVPDYDSAMVLGHSYRTSHLLCLWVYLDHLVLKIDGDIGQVTASLEHEPFKATAERLELHRE